MFLKLFKYEFKKLATTNLIIFGAQILLGILLSVAMKLMNTNVIQDGALAVLVVAVMGISMLAIYALAFATMIIVFYRFFKAVASDEAYLTFTLPISVSKQLLARTLVIVVWVALSAIATLIAFILFLGLSILPESFRDIFEELKELYATIRAQEVITIILFLVLSVVSFLMSIVEVEFAIVFAQRLSKKFRGGITIGLIIALSYAQGILFSVLTIPLTFSVEVSSPDQLISRVNIMLGITLLACVAFTALCYYLSYYFLNKKLNLD